NQVEVEVPTGAVEQFCAASAPALHGASGAKRGLFKVKVSSLGISHITFYLDGRKIKLLKQAQASGGKFTITIDARKLSYGAHRLKVTAVSSAAECRVAPRSSVFVRPRSERFSPTG